MEFHISQRIRRRYQLYETLFSTTGNVIFANFRAAREFAQKINAQRNLTLHPEQAVRAGQLNAMGLIDEILHVVIEKYRQQISPQVMRSALETLYAHFGQSAVETTLAQFVAEFPPLSVYQGRQTIQDYLNGETAFPAGVRDNRSIALEEMLLLWLANVNPAFQPFNEFFDDRNLSQNTAYPQIIASLHQFFESQPHFGPDDQNLVDMLHSPAIAVPHSLAGQLEYIRSKWGYLLGDILKRLMTSLDFIKEEEKVVIGGSGVAPVLDFRGMELEDERFSPDREWMPCVVMLAKNTYVWLDQLSKKYQRPIYRLDHIPDEELDQLARWGFNALWLIGLWERSRASQRIKQLRGNPEAVASAYSLFDYTIAADLGGEEAYRNLSHRAWMRGIRLASDMVPNHMGIDSPWVINHPDWFISVDQSPFPSYTFNGPNLSWDERVGIYIEDHYFDNTDAAVVFKRVDNWSGQTKYIYHGNDGTSMPWNDTAQLNYLLPEVREAVIQTILKVARRFPIIRFDAAMTLAKRHYQRLWYPEPGGGGDIPSRAEHAMTKEQFNAAFPKEFWREVVDRVAEEIPDTLLLAEAFWLMEGYFVRTLGMHRVYNSAFMNMLRDEKNQEYRLVIKNTLEFDPDILKRYVNFMNNPDERTAVDQFGKGDKYFGICTMMVTLPGLPMFGHGQIEGFTEKYGMEYRRAYWDEYPDPALMERHEKQIFPLLKKRYLFAESANFLLYDFFTPSGSVNEDVFAYTNKSGDETALVVYHNRFASTEGWLRTSCAYLEKDPASGSKSLVQKNLNQALDIRNEPHCYTLFRDLTTGYQYVRNNQQLCEQGLFLHLDAYQCHVFSEFQQVQDTPDGIYRRLSEVLGIHGTPDLEQAKLTLLLQPVHFALGELINEGQYRWLIQHRQCTQVKPPSVNLDALLDEVQNKVLHLEQQIRHFLGLDTPHVVLPQKIRSEIHFLLTSLEALHPPEVVQLLCGADHRSWSILLSWVFLHYLGTIQTQDKSDSNVTISRWYDQWQLSQITAHAGRQMELSPQEVERLVQIIRLLLRYPLDLALLTDPHEWERQLKTWMSDADFRQFIQCNEYQGITWFHKESFEEWLNWLQLTTTFTLVHSYQQGQITEGVYQNIKTAMEAEFQRLKSRAQTAAYQLHAFVDG
ncbi:MAG: alpha-amylase family glycosyl hydrolase [Chloroflexota bacterium]